MQIKSLAACAALLLLSACGGGGGGAPESVLSASTMTVTARSQGPNAQPQEIVLLSVSNPPKDGFASGVAFTQNGIGNAQLAPLSDSAANLLINFKPAGSLAPGVYQDLISVVACHDADCKRQFKNSPLTINVTYTVTGTSDGGSSGNGQTSIRSSESSQSTSAAQDDAAPSSFTPLVYIDNPPPAGGLTVKVQHSRNGVSLAQSNTINPNTLQMQIAFKAPADLAVGSYDDETLLQVCLDSACNQPVQGSPLRFNTRYTVEPRAAPLLPIASSSRLGFNVVDAEYSTALESLVIVSTAPRNALHLVNAASGSVSSLNLNKVPTAVSLSPDGRSAAVGHDALITLVNLIPATAGGSLSAQNLNVAAQVGDLVLDGNGYVHVFPESDQHVSIHTVRIATNTETLNSGRTIYARTKGRLHPSGSVMYGANNGLSPSDIEKYSAPANGAVAYLYDSPYHGDYAMCGNLWFAENGSTIYTACGNTFSSSTTQSQDMIYRGAMALTRGDFGSYVVRSLTHSGETKEIVLIEQNGNCGSQSGSTDCKDRVSYYESDFLNRTASYAVPPQNLDGTPQRQEPLFVFHNGSGSMRYLLTRLPQAAATETYLHRLQ